MKQRVDTEFDESRVVSARRGSAHRRKAATALLVGGVLCGGLANAQEADQMPPPAEAAPTAVPVAAPPAAEAATAAATPRVPAENTEPHAAPVATAARKSVAAGKRVSVLVEPRVGRPN